MEALGWWRFSFLPGEISSGFAPSWKRRSALRGNMRWVTGREVSRGHSTRKVNRGAMKDAHIKLRNPSSTIAGKGRTNIGEPTCAPSRNSNRRHGAMSVENRMQAETASSRGYTLVDVLDPENLAQLPGNG